MTKILGCEGMQYNLYNQNLYDQPTSLDKKYVKKKEGYEIIKCPEDGKKEIPIIELEPLLDSIPLTRNNMPFGIRGYWIIGDNKCYHFADDRDPYRVIYHETLHKRINRSNPNHPEWEIRMLEDLRLGEENYN